MSADQILLIILAAPITIYTARKLWKYIHKGILYIGYRIMLIVENKRRKKLGAKTLDVSKPFDKED